MNTKQTYDFSKMDAMNTKQTLQTLRNVIYISCFTNAPFFSDHLSFVSLLSAKDFSKMDVIKLIKEDEYKHKMAIN